MNYRILDKLERYEYQINPPTEFRDYLVAYEDKIDGDVYIQTSVLEYNPDADFGSRWRKLHKNQIIEYIDESKIGYWWDLPMIYELPIKKLTRK